MLHNVSFVFIYLETVDSSIFWDPLFVYLQIFSLGDTEQQKPTMPGAKFKPPRAPGAITPASENLRGKPEAVGNDITFSIKM